MKHPLSPVYNGENRPKNDDTIRLWSSSAPLPRASSARARGSCSSISKPPIRELDVINSVFLEPPFFTNYYFGFSEGKHPLTRWSFLHKHWSTHLIQFPADFKMWGLVGEVPCRWKFCAGLFNKFCREVLAQLHLRTAPCQCGITFAFCPEWHRKSQFSYTLVIIFVPNSRRFIHCFSIIGTQLTFVIEKTGRVWIRSFLRKILRSFQEKWKMSNRMNGYIEVRMDLWKEIWSK